MMYTEDMFRELWSCTKIDIYIQYIKIILMCYYILTVKYWDRWNGRWWKYIPGGVYYVVKLHSYTHVHLLVFLKNFIHLSD